MLLLLSNSHSSSMYASVTCEKTATRLVQGLAFFFSLSGTCFMMIGGMEMLLELMMR